MSKPPSLLDIEDILCSNENRQNQRDGLKLPLQLLDSRIKELSVTYKALSHKRTADHPLPKALERYRIGKLATNPAPAIQVYSLWQRYDTFESREQGSGASLIPEIEKAIKNAVTQVPKVILAISILELLDLFISFFWVKETQQNTTMDDNKFAAIDEVLSKQIGSLAQLLQTTPTKIPRSTTGLPKSASSASITSQSPLFPVSPSMPSIPTGSFSSPPPRSSMVGLRGGFVMSSTSSPLTSPLKDVKDGPHLSEAPDLSVMLAQARLQRTRAKIALYKAAERQIPEYVTLAEQEYDFQCKLYERRAQGKNPEPLEDLPALVKALGQLKWELREAKTISAEQQAELDNAEFKFLSKYYDWHETRYQEQREVVRKAQTVIASPFGVSEKKRSANLNEASEVSDQLGKEKRELEQKWTLLRARICKNQQQKIRLCAALGREIESLRKLSLGSEEEKARWQVEIKAKNEQNTELQAEIAKALLIKEPSDHPCYRDNVRIAAQSPEQSRLEYLTDFLRTETLQSFTQAEQLEKANNQLRHKLSRLCLRLMSGALLQMTQRNLAYFQAKPTDFASFVNWLQVVALIPDFGKTVQPLLEVLQGFARENLSPFVANSNSLTETLQAEAKLLEKSLDKSGQDYQDFLVKKLLPELQKQQIFLDRLTNTIEFACQQQKVEELDSKVIVPPLTLDLSADLEQRMRTFDQSLIAKTPLSDDDELDFKWESKKPHQVSKELKFFIEEGVYKMAPPGSSVSSGRSSSSPASAGRSRDTVTQEFSNYCQTLLTSGKPLSALLQAMDEKDSELDRVRKLSVITSKTLFRSFRQVFLDDITRMEIEVRDLEIEKQFIKDLGDLIGFFNPLHKKLGLGVDRLNVNECIGNILAFVKHLQRNEANSSMVEFRVGSSDAKAAPEEYGQPLEHKVTIYSQKILARLLRILTKPEEEEKRQATDNSKVFFEILFSELIKVKLSELLVSFIELRRQQLGEKPLGFKAASNKSAETFEKLLSNYVLTQPTDSTLYRCVKWLRNLIMSPKLLDLERLEGFYLPYSKEARNKTQKTFDSAADRSYSGRLFHAIRTQLNFLSPRATRLECYRRLRQEVEKYNEFSTFWLSCSALLIRGEIQLQIADEQAEQLRQQEKTQQQLQTHRLKQKQIEVKLGKLKAPHPEHDPKPPLANLLSFCRISNCHVAAQKLQAITDQWKKITLDLPTILKIKTQGYLVTFVHDETCLPPDWQQKKDKVIYIFWVSISGSVGQFRFNYVINLQGVPQVRTIDAVSALVSADYHGKAQSEIRKNPKIVPDLDLSEFIFNQERTLVTSVDMAKVQAHLSDEEQFQLSMVLLQKADQKISQPLKEVAALLAEPPSRLDQQTAEGDSELKPFSSLFAKTSAAAAQLAATQLNEAVQEFKSTFYPLFDSHDKVHRLFRKYRRLCADEKLLTALKAEAVDGAQAPATVAKFAVETYDKWIEKIKHLAARFRSERPDMAAALERLQQGIEYGEVKDASLSLPPLPDAYYAPVVTLLFPELGITTAESELPELKEFTQTKWVQRLAAVENLHAIVSTLETYVLVLYSVENEAERDKILRSLQSPSQSPILFKCGSHDTVSYYIYGLKDRSWQLTRLDCDYLNNLKFPKDSKSNSSKLSKNRVPSSRGVVRGTQESVGSLDPADKPRNDDDVLNLAPLDSKSSITMQSNKIPILAMYEIKKGHQTNLAYGSLLEHLEKLHKDLITGAWRRKMMESPMEKAKKGKELQMLLGDSTLSLIENVLGMEGIGGIDRMGVMRYGVYERLSPHIFTLWSWKFEEGCRASYQALFYDFLFKSEYDVDLIEYDSIYAAVSAKDREWLHHVDLVALANDHSTGTSELRQKVAKAIAPHNLDNFLAKKKIRVQVGELLGILGMLRTEQADILKWLDEVDMELLQTSKEERIAVKNPSWLNEVNDFEQKTPRGHKDWSAGYLKLDIHKKTRLYIVNQNLVHLRTEPVKFNHELRIKLVGVGILGEEVIGFWRNKKTRPALSLAWLNEINRNLLDDSKQCALKKPGEAPYLCRSFPKLQALISNPAEFNAELKKELKKCQLLELKEDPDPAKKEKETTKKEALTDLSQMIVRLQALADLHPDQQARIIKELISPENPRLRHFIRWLQAMVDRSDPNKLEYQLLSLQRKKKDIIARFKSIAGSHITLADETERSVIDAFRQIEDFIKGKVESFSFSLNSPGFSAVLADAVVVEVVQEEEKRGHLSDTVTRNPSPSTMARDRLPSTITRSCTPSPDYQEGDGLPSSLRTYSSNGSPDRLFSSPSPSPDTPPSKKSIVNNGKTTVLGFFGSSTAVLPNAIQDSPSNTPTKRKAKKKIRVVKLSSPTSPTLASRHGSLAPTIERIDSAVQAISNTRESLNDLVEEFKKKPEHTEEIKSAAQFSATTPAQLCLELVNKLDDRQAERARLLEEVKKLTEETAALQKAIAENTLPNAQRAARIKAEVGRIRDEIKAKDNELAALIQVHNSKVGRIEEQKSKAESTIESLNKQLKNLETSPVLLDQKTPGGNVLQSKQEKQKTLDETKEKLRTLNPKASEEVKQKLRAVIAQLTKDIEAMSPQQEGPSIVDIQALLRSEIKEHQEKVTECVRELKQSLFAIANQATQRIELAEDEQQLRRTLSSLNHQDTFSELPPMADLPAGTPRLDQREACEARLKRRFERIDEELRTALPGLLVEKTKQLNTLLDQLYDLEAWVLTPVIKATVEQLRLKTSEMEQTDESSSRAQKWKAQSQALIDWLQEPKVPEESDVKSLVGRIMELKINAVPEQELKKIQNIVVQDRYKKLMEESQEIITSKDALIKSVERLQTFISKTQTRRSENLTAQSPLEITLEFKKLKYRCELWNRKSLIIMEQVEGYFLAPGMKAQVLDQQKRDCEEKLSKTLPKEVIDTLRQQDLAIRAQFEELVKRYVALEEFVVAREKTLAQLESLSSTPDVLDDEAQLPSVEPRGKFYKEIELLNEFNNVFQERVSWRQSQSPDKSVSQNPQSFFVNMNGGVVVQDNYFVTTPTS